MIYPHRFPSIPDDLSIVIYKFRFIIATNTIIKYWYKHIAKKITATNLIIKTTETNLSGQRIVTIDPTVVSNLEYCSRNLNSTLDKAWWNNKLKKISNSLDFSGFYYWDGFTDTEKILHSRSRDAYEILHKKINNLY